MRRAGPGDWDDEDPIISEQPSTWLYWNERQQLVLRQQQSGLEDETPFLFFSIENVPALIRALQQRLTELGSAEDLPEPWIEAEAARRPLKAVERQRRRRDKQRDELHEARDEPALLFSLSDRAR
jgi:hypothetical protein